MSREQKLPLFEQGIAAFADDPAISDLDWSKLDKSLAGLVYDHLVRRRSIRRNDQNVAFLRATGGKLPRIPKSAFVAPRGSSNRFPQGYRASAAERPKPMACEVCGDGGTICFEHDHSSGHFRGWLCAPCNSSLGFARDQPERLRKLAVYLEEHNRRIAKLPPLPTVVKHRRW